MRNNPVSNVDPDGHTCVTTDNGEVADNMDGKGCDQMNNADGSGVTVSAKPGNAIGAFFLNFGFALDNAANDYFSWMFTQRPQTLANTSVSDSGVGTSAKVAAFVGPGLIGPEAESESVINAVVESAESSYNSQISNAVRALDKKLGHAASKGFSSAFEGVNRSDAGSLVRQIMENPARRVTVGNTIRIFNSSGQGVWFNSITNTFIGFVEGTLE